MSHQNFFISCPWARYSKKLAERIVKPRHGGLFTEEEAKARSMRCAVGTEGGDRDANIVALYWLVDESDGVIADAKFQVFGHSALIGAAEIACELLIRKNYDQARHVSSEMLDLAARDKEGNFAFPSETRRYVNLVLGAIEQAANQCIDISLPTTYVSTPERTASLSDGEGYPGWNALGTAQKLAVIEEVIAADIRPYIELDAGGVRIIDLVNDRELIIAYEGACTSCYSATGATLDAIGQLLRSKVDPHLIVVPDMSFLSQTTSPEYSLMTSPVGNSNSSLPLVSIERQIPSIRLDPSEKEIFSPL